MSHNEIQTNDKSFLRKYFGWLAPRNVATEPNQSYLNLVNRYVWFLVLFWVLMIGAVSATLYSLFDGHFRDADIASEDLRWRYLSITAMIAALGAMIAVPFTLVRVYVNERQATNAEQGHITDRITKAVEQLGAEKTVKKVVAGATVEYTEPNIEVRLGAIYALERISQDSLRDHIPIMETLCAYIRNNARVEGAKDFPLGPFPERVEADGADVNVKREIRAEMFKARRQNWSDWLTHLGPLRPPRDDVAAVFKVIARRSTVHRSHEENASPSFRLDFTRANLQRCDLNGLDLNGADMRGARLEGADLSGAEMEGADLSGAKMEGADLSGARLKSADLAFWSGARTNARSADFTQVKNMDQSQVNALFGDTNTLLPENVKRTTELSHPPLENLWDNDPEFERWKAAGYPPGVPIEDNT